MTSRRNRNRTHDRHRRGVVGGAAVSSSQATTTTTSSSSTKHRRHRHQHLCQSNEDGPTNISKDDDDEEEVNDEEEEALDEGEGDDENNDNEDGNEEEDDDDEDEDDDDDDDFSASFKVVRITSHAVQDAGTLQMLRDESTYLCASMLQARSTTQALEATLELATMLSNRKTRNLLWQQQQQPQQETQQPQQNQQPQKQPSSSPTVLKTILQALAKIAPLAAATITTPTSTGSTSSVSASVDQQKQQEHPSQCNPTKISTTLKNQSPPRFRTKSARRKLKEEPLLQDASCGSIGVKPPAITTTTTSSTTTMMQLCPELKQALCILVYYISWDCTLSREHSIAASAAIVNSNNKSIRSKSIHRPNPTLARHVRWTIMEHGQALQGILRLVLSSNNSNNNDVQQRQPMRINSHYRQPQEKGLHTSASTVCSTKSKLNGNNNNDNNHTNGSVTFQKNNQTPMSLSSPSLSLSSPTMTSTTTTTSVGSSSCLSFSGPNDISKNGTISEGGDPTALGRRKRRNKRKLQQEQHLPSLPEEENDENVLDWLQNSSSKDENDDDHHLSIIPPPSSRSKQQQHKDAESNFSSQNGSGENVHKNNAFAFATPTSPPRQQPRRRRRIDNATTFSSMVNSPDKSLASSVGSENTVLMTQVARKLETLRSKILLHHPVVSSSSSLHQCENTKEFYNDDDNDNHDHHDSWVSMVCLESLQRILTGKDDIEGGPSCLEPSENEDDNDNHGEEEDSGHSNIQNEDANPILKTNNVLSKSGSIPLLAQCMSQTLREICLYITTTATNNNHVNGSSDSSSRNECGVSYWTYWNDRLSLLASMIDGACLFHKGNRRSFAQEDPFSFDDQNQEGLVYHILWFLHSSSTLQHQLQVQNNNENNKNIEIRHKIGGIRLLALQTLTSLTHDNELAAQQMTQCYDFGDGGGSGGDSTENRNNKNNDRGRRTTESPSLPSSPRGIDILAGLVYELQGPHEEDKDCTKKDKKKQGRVSRDEELHRYDSTNFCLNTLANIIEASDVRRHLAEITIQSSSPSESTSSSSTSSTLWLKWLCRWVVCQTDTFRDSILAIGKPSKESSSSTITQRELQKHEEDKLVAAGNGCVLLACLMKEPEEISEEPESTNVIRNLILEQMPQDAGIKMIINTLKAFCNFYHFSVGDLSVAIIAPVKKLIVELEELERTELRPKDK